MPRIGFKRALDRRGNVALVTALLAPVLVLISGGAIDVTNAAMRQAQLQQSVDAAAVAAVARYSIAYTQFLSMTSDGPVAPANFTPNTRAVFNADYQPSGTSQVTSFSASAQKTGSTLTATVSATAAFKPSFLGLIGMNSMNLSATSISAASLPTYVRYYILVDGSQSMGIASTQSDMNTLYARVAAYGNGSDSDGSAGCVFGCHVTTNTNYGSKLMQLHSNEYLAHNISPKITLRIDSAIAAIQDILVSAQNASNGTGNVQIGIYEINKDPVSGTYVTQIAAPSSNYTSLSTLANNIDLGNNTAGGIGDTDFPNEINYFVNNYLQPNGTGLSASSPANYVFLVSDGLYDIYGGGCTDTHCTNAFVSNGTTDASCSQIKAQATVGVIYTTYNPIYYENTPPTLGGSYNALAYRYASGNPSQITTNMTACASSPNLFYSASNGPQIEQAMQQLFSSTLKTAHLVPQ